MNPFSISKPFAAAFVLLSVVSFAWGQEATRYVCLTLDNKTVRCGQLISDDGREMTIQTPDMGKIIVPKIQVVRIVDAPAGTRGSSGSADIELSERMLNPERALQSTRYFFAPSAHTLKKGEGYASVTGIAIGNVTYGISDSFMAGFSISPLGAGVTGKVGLELDDGVQLSAGGLFQLGWDGGGVSFPFANLTFGNENEHLTVAYGWLFGSIGGDDIDSPMLNVSGCLQVSDNAWIMSENYLFARPEFFPTNAVMSFGMRLWSARKQRLFEPAFMLLIDDENNATPVPWVGWTWPF